VAAMQNVVGSRLLWAVGSRFLTAGCDGAKRGGLIFEFCNLLKLS
jgi:hypothetical protein